MGGLDEEGEHVTPCRQNHQRDDDHAQAKQGCEPTALAGKQAGSSESMQLQRYHWHHCQQGQQYRQGPPYLQPLEGGVDGQIGGISTQWEVVQPRSHQRVGGVCTCDGSDEQENR